MTLPTKPNYISETGIPIFMIDGANVGTRSVPGEVLYLVTHLSEGTDSREYLRKNDRGVSTHYLAGEYPDTNGPRVYKYASETTAAAYTQGFGILGRLARYSHDGGDWSRPLNLSSIRNLNDVAIGYEIEGTPQKPPSERLMLVVAQHQAELIRYWNARNRQLVMIRHLDVDSAKQDPQGLDWVDFCKQVYRNV